MKYISAFDVFVNESRVKKSDRIDILRDDKYIVVAPLTHVASCKYGANTHWCTSAPGTDYIWSEGNIPNKTNGNDLLIYVIVRNKKTDYDLTDRFYYLTNMYDNGEIEEDSLEYEEFRDLSNDKNALDMSKIAVTYNTKRKSYNIWSGNNIHLEYGFNQLDLDDYVIDAIKEFCTEFNENYLNESLENKIKLILDSRDSSTDNYLIKHNNEIVGSISCGFSGDTLNVDYIEINKEKRGQKIGQLTLKELVRKYKKYNMFHKLTADCLSQESFFTFVSAFGKPFKIYTTLREIYTFDEVVDYLPLVSAYDNEGDLIGGDDSAVHVVYEFKSLTKQI